MFKESDIAYETKGGAAWVRRDSKGNRYTVFRAGVTHSTSDSAYPLDANGLSLAKARADYIQRRAWIDPPPAASELGNV